MKKNLISLFHINSEPVLKFKSHSTSVIYSIMIVVNIIQGLFIVSVKVEMPVTHNVLQATSHTLWLIVFALIIYKKINLFKFFFIFSSSLRDKPNGMQAEIINLIFKKIFSFLKQNHEKDNKLEFTEFWKSRNPL